MSDFILQQHSLTVIQVNEGKSPAYSLDTAAQHAGIHPELLRYYCRAGLLSDRRFQTEPEPVFDDEAIYELQRIEHYRRKLGVNLSALPVVLDLLREIEALRNDLRFRQKHSS